jgi:hypothetical protein
MVDVVSDKEALEKSKIDAITIEQIRRKMMEAPSATRPRSSGKGKKWEEIVRLNGAKYAVVCHWEGGKVIMTNWRVSPTRKFRVRK